MRCCSSAASGLPALEQIVSAAPAAAATRAATVAVTPSMTEGPYWIDEMLRRFDVRANTGSSTTVQAGVPLTLKINVLDASSGGAINGAHVDIWHANAYGLYSDESGQQTGGGTTEREHVGPELPSRLPGHGHRRRRRLGPVDGQVSFKTIWPGWYNGRAIHIHVRVRTYNGSSVATNYTTQIFFSDADNATVLNGAAPVQHALAEDRSDDRRDRQRAHELRRRHERRPGDRQRSPTASRATFTIGLTGVASNASAGVVDRHVGLGEPRAPRR